MIDVLLARVAALEARVVALERQRQTFSRADADALARLLPAFGGAFGSEWFTVRELQASETVAVRVVLSGWSSKRLGKLFARAVGASIAGFALEQSGKAHGAACWRVVGEFETRETPLTPSVAIAAMRPLSQGDSLS